MESNFGQNDFPSDDEDDAFLSMLPLDNLPQSGETTLQLGTKSQSGVTTLPLKATSQPGNETPQPPKCQSQSRETTLGKSQFATSAIKTEKNPATDVDIKTGVKVDIPEKFAFPFEPYNIQVGFMSSLYESLETKKIGIFESPTGTGKSLSLICGALTWLKDYEERQKAELELLLTRGADSSKEEVNRQQATIGDSTKKELDWISDFAQKRENEEHVKKFKEEQEARLKKEQKLQEIKKQLNPLKGKRKRDKLQNDFDELMKGAPKSLQEEYTQAERESDGPGEISNDGDDDLVVADYNSDEGKDRDSSDEEEEEYHVTKIYYCSRTHSQLSQFVKEIQKSPFGENTRVVSLGSRQNMCINESVKKLKSLSLMNDRCLELQKNKKGSEKKENGATVKRRKSVGTCPYYKQDPLLEYRDRILVDVNDIEEQLSIGKQMKACPYYGARYAIPAAEVVALPYNSLLHKSTREACGIKLAGNIIIVDEAHNLLETINNIHSVEITGSQITQAYSQLSQYFDRYRSRLKAKNLLYIKQLLFVLQGFLSCLGGKTGIPADQQILKEKETKLQTINNFLFSTKLDNVNLFKVKRYCEKSLISKKLNAFVEKYQAHVVTKAPEKKEETSTSGVHRFLQEIIHQSNSKQKSKQDLVEEQKESEESKERGDNYASLRSPLLHIEGFLESLTNADKDGRVVVNKQNLLSKSSVKFLLLNPAIHFVSVIEQARAVVVAGGTMQPVSEFKDQLFHAAGVHPDRILEYSCGHVIPAEQLLPIALATGPSGIELDFTYQSRDKPELLDELGRLTVNVCTVVPGGIVCFFPSYDYQRMVYSHWEKTGFLNRMNQKKKVFQEPRRAGLADQVLSHYTDAIRNKSGCSVTGAILLCVVGGKMSEGINFSDDMGRCVMMIGLPYPNMYSPELKEKMAYLNANFPKNPDGRLPGQVHYENLCMKAVNQSIGRAIRHKNDYATILLLDQRYLRGNIISKLPTWISKHLVKMERFGPAYGAVTKFFNGKKPP